MTHSTYNTFMRILQVLCLLISVVAVSAQTPIQSPLTYEPLLPTLPPHHLLVGMSQMGITDEVFIPLVYRGEHDVEVIERKRLLSRL